jgi:hypothetical protein
MDELPKPGQTGLGLLAIILWLVSFGLGLQAIYDLTQLVILLQVELGGGLENARLSAMTWIFVLALLFLIFVIVSTEYHIKRFGKMESWRLFGWTIAVEVSIIVLYFIL